MNCVVLARNGATKEIPRGFSWTTFTFGFIPSFIRGHYEFLWYSLALDFSASILSLIVFRADDHLLAILIARLAAGILRNEALMQHFLSKGWTIAEESVKFRLLGKDAANEEEMDHEDH